MCKSTTVNTPAPQNYGQQTSDTLQSQINLAPQQYAAESQFQPLYNSTKQLRQELPPPEYSSLFGSV